MLHNLLFLSSRHPYFFKNFSCSIACIPVENDNYGDDFLSNYFFIIIIIILPQGLSTAQGCMYISLRMNIWIFEGEIPLLMRLLNWRVMSLGPSLNRKPTEVNEPTTFLFLHQPWLKPVVLIV